jgi:PST family polysaccharide transporter
MRVEPVGLESDDRATGTNPSLGRAAARGMVWMTLSTLTGRIFAVVAQCILGWLLSDNDFGVYGVAIGVSMLVMQLRTIGTDRVLMQRAAEYDQLAAPVARLTLIVNSLAALLLVSLAWPAARFYRAPELTWLILLIAGALPAGVAGQVLRAKLAIGMRYETLATVDMTSFFCRQLLTIVLALRGFGPYSLAIPALVIPLLEAILLTKLAGRWAPGRPLDRSLAYELFQSARWILLCGFASTFITQGNVLILGRWESAAVAGIFFFGFQLVSSVADLFRVGTFTVLMPTLSRVAHDPRRHGQAFMKAIRLFVLVQSPVCVAVAVVLPPVMHLVWRSKWDASIPVVRWFTLVLPVYLLFNLCSAALESRGEWRLNTLMHYANALATVTAAAIGVAWGSLWEVTICAAITRWAIGLLAGLFVTWQVGQPMREFLCAVFPPYLLALGAGAVALGLGQSVGLDSLSLLPAALSVAAYVLCLAIGYRIWFWHSLREVIDLAMRPAASGSA